MIEFLNTRQVKELNKRLFEQHGSDFGKEYFIVITGGEKIYLVNKEVAKINLEKLRVDKYGLYVANENKMGLRLTIEGAEIIGKNANKNVVDLDTKQTNSWMLGEDVELDSEQLSKIEDKEKFIIVKHKKDFLSSGKLKKGENNKGNTLLNFVSKDRRVGASFESFE